MATATRFSLATLPDRLVLFDGVCGLCNNWVDRVLREDKRGLFYFAPLQGSTAAALRDQFPELIPDEISTVVLVDTSGLNPRIWVRSEAVLRICGNLIDSPLRRLSLLLAFPRILRDGVYRLIAASRYRIWGKRDTCRVPTAAERARFLP
ncbi:MAG: DUF393 domain-containing protein [Myxococcales bacterium]|nr:DUF393 domain-containing protein [Myxococcales bacterium]